MSLTSREVTAIHTICQMATAFKEKDSEMLSQFTSAYLIQLALLRRLPLSHRSLCTAMLDVQKCGILPQFTIIAAEVIRRLTSPAAWDSFDLLDGRLLILVKGRPYQDRLPKSLLFEVRQFTEMIKSITQMDLSPSMPLEQPEPADRAGPDLTGYVSDDPKYTILPFSHPTMDKYLENMHAVADDTYSEEKPPKIFRELSHWHNARVPVDVKQPPRPKTAWQKRLDQKWMASYIKYSASLTNSSGKMIDPEVIVVDSEKPKQGPVKHDKPKPPHPAASKAGGKKGQGKSGKQQALETARALMQEKQSVKSNSALTLWDEQKRLLEDELDLVKRYHKVTKCMTGLTNEANAAVGIKATVYACDILASILAKTGRDTAAGKRIWALMWSQLRGLSEQDPSLSILTQKAYIYPATIGFQLQHCGPFLERSFDPAPDPRVPFHPDAWQRQVLDAIDADKSLFVVAPTSAGKTFISFYAMKKVLKMSDTGILVYVAPTKALVNQIAAEIQARFTKTFGTQSGKSVWAIHTRDYRVNSPMGCQILITVPHVLQIMLMAPSNAANPNSWSRRIQRIIFDEVHCIGQADDGIVWEQLLLLAPCPIIALSATVGNPMEFKSWLEGSEKAKGHKFEMVVHSTRYSDLRKFVWKPHKPFVFDGLQSVYRLPVPGLDNGSATAARFSHIHPVASLLNHSRGTIQDLNIEPRECETLWASMAKHQTKEYPLPSSLNPDKALPKIVRKADLAAYDKTLKDILEVWMADRTSPFKAVQKELRGGPGSNAPVDGSRSGGTRDTIDLQKRANTMPSSIHPSLELRRNILPLVRDLHHQGALPAILFNYDRVNCEDIALHLLSDLENAEQSWKSSSLEWQKKLAKFSQWQKDSSKIRTAARKASKAKAKVKGGDDEVNERVEDDVSAWESFDPEAPLPSFSLADTTKLSRSELEAEIWSIRRKRIDPKIILALRRGIGVHHAGMNRMYRQVVEMLFRKGFLRVIIATGTLALGLNMPCKTVVFYGDSVFLTALNYHQCAGRAGRRGFDLLGNVVFANMSKERAYEIMSSRLPDLRGHFPLSTTLVLRTLGLLHHTENSEFAVRAVKSLLSQTRLYLGGPSNQFAIKHQLRFSIEYLRRQHLLSQDGSPLNFAGLVGHLYFTENSVFAFHSLLKEGYFHTLCKNFTDSRQEILLTLCLVLSHLFCRFPTGHISDARREVIRRSPSCVILPDLPQKALEILRQHNRETLDIFKNYTASFVGQHLSGDVDERLPFTGCKAGADHDVAPDTNIRQLLGCTSLPPTKIRSPFVALSGFGDDSFESIHELCATVRSGVFLEESAIPYLSLYPDDTDGQPWNAYIYDFYKHGDLVALVRDNLCKRGDVWFHLKDFSLVLATIVTSLKNFMDLDSAADADLSMMDIQDIHDELAETAELVDEEEETPVRASNGAPDDAALKKPSQADSSKKAKVSESWDDSDSDAGDDTESVGSATSGKNPAWAGDGEQMLPQVLQIFVALQMEFNEKFMKIWA